MNKKVIILLLLFVLCTLCITGCAEKEKKKCIESHEEVKNIYFYNGGRMTFIPTTRTVCDKYE